MCRCRKRIGTQGQGLMVDADAYPARRFFMADRIVKCRSAAPGWKHRGARGKNSVITLAINSLVYIHG